jgi:hypothetical protein
MGTLTLENQAVEYQWASDLAFAGIRMEILTEEGDMLFDISLPDDGPTTVNTFGREVAADLINAALTVVAQRR